VTDHIERGAGAISTVEISFGAVTPVVMRTAPGVVGVALLSEAADATTDFGATSFDCRTGTFTEFWVVAGEFA
jgi:hypothetical protein